MNPIKFETFCILITKYDSFCFANSPSEFYQLIHMMSRDSISMHAQIIINFWFQFHSAPLTQQCCCLQTKMINNVLIIVLLLFSSFFLVTIPERESVCVCEI